MDCRRSQYAELLKRLREPRRFITGEGDREVDFVLRRGKDRMAIEVKIGRYRGELTGMQAFARCFNPSRSVRVGEGGLPLEEFLLMPVPDLFPMA
ncbi:MAG: hypothetical protein KA419_13590 [Acidobacteria bacterium]|nr:hypothetical protein [Acidobacteriota bacterium]